MNPMGNVIIAGGGTGGHLFPGVALADELQAKGYHVVFVGTKQGIETKILPKLGYILHTIVVRGVKGQSFWKKLWGYCLLPIALIQSFYLLIKIRPRFVVGVGGYASFPIVFLASIFRFYTVLLEQNAIPGLSNRWLAQRAQRIFTSFMTAENYFPKERVRLYGNPIRASLTRKLNYQVHHPLQVLVLGGSLGAHAINQAMLDCVDALDKKSLLPRVKIKHQCGKNDEISIQSVYQNYTQKLSLEAVSFIDNMAEAYLWADVIISRAGATTIAELTYSGLPSILIPYPYAADDHQTYNAQFLVDKGAAKLFPQKELTGLALAQQIESFLTDSSQLQSMAQASFALGYTGVSQKIIHEIESQLN